MSKIDLMRKHALSGYGSEFDSECETKEKKTKREDISKSRKRPDGVKLPARAEVSDEHSKEEFHRQRIHFQTLDAYSRHKKLVNSYLQFYGGSKNVLKRDSSRDKTDMDVIREHHQFLWDDDEDDDSSWEKRLAKKYYDKLFKEYCISDLSRYKENKFAFRWRIDKECISGKGQFICGNKKCMDNEGLRSWEVNFSYHEHGEKKNALVKLRLCPDCSYKLNYRHKKREIKAKKSMERNRSDIGLESAPQLSSSADAELLKDGSSTSSIESSTQVKTEENIWTGPVKVDEDKSREEEFDDYFEDMLL